MKIYWMQHPGSIGQTFMKLLSGGPTEPFTVHPLFDEYLSFAFDHDGFVAGGLARKVSQFYTFTDHDGGCFARRVTDLSKYRSTMNGYLNNWWPEQGGGDADIYFTTQAGFDAFNARLMADVERGTNIRFLAKNNRVTSYRVTDNNPTTSRKDANLQAILSLVDIETTLSWFDLGSAMIAFDNGFFYTSDDYMQHREMLHVVNWKDPVETFYRSIKWMRKHNLHSISPETSQRLGSIALDAIDLIQQQPGGKVALVENNMQRWMTKEHVIETLQPHLTQLSDNQLLLLMSVMPDKANKHAYNFFPAPIDILMSRLERTMASPSSG